MSKYGKYFLQHILWLQDEFCDYYVQDHTWCPQDILDVPCIIFDFREDAHQWLHQCVTHDRITAIHRLRRFLAYECLEYIQVHRLNDQQVIQAAARQLTLQVHKIVIKPEFGWAVQLADTAEPVLPVTIEPEPDVDSLLAELKVHLDGLVAEQQKKYDQYETQLAAMSPEQRAAVYSQKAGSGIYDGTLGGIVDLVKAAPCIFSGYLKILAKAAALPAQAAQLTARAMAEGDIGVLTHEIDRIATSISQNIDQALEYKAMLQIVLSDDRTMEILYDFAHRYYKATHPIELTEMGASALSDVVVTILLALLTAGVGAAANILSKSARLAKAAKLLRKIATVLKRTGSRHRLPKKHLDARTSSGTLTKATKAKKSGIRPIEPPATKTLPGPEKDPELIDSLAKKDHIKNVDADGPKKTKKLPEEPQLRVKYENEVGLLKEKAEKLKKEGKTSEEIARILHSDRRAIGLKYKDLTPSELREKIYKMNKKDYGDPLGPSIDYLRNLKGKTWDQIIESASNPGGWSRLCEFLEKNGIDPHTYFQKF